jgi:hypothetical protein
MERKERMVQSLIRHSPPEQFKDLFLWYPQTRLSNRLGKNTQRFKAFIDDPGLFKVQELLQIADIFEVELSDIVRLVFAQIVASRRYSCYKCIKAGKSPAKR